MDHQHVIPGLQLLAEEAYRRAPEDNRTGLRKETDTNTPMWDVRGTGEVSVKDEDQLGATQPSFTAVTPTYLNVFKSDIFKAERVDDMKPVSSIYESEQQEALETRSLRSNSEHETGEEVLGSSTLTCPPMLKRSDFASTSNETNPNIATEKTPTSYEDFQAMIESSQECMKKSFKEMLEKQLRTSRDDLNGFDLQLLKRIREQVDPLPELHGLRVAKGRHASEIRRHEAEKNLLKQGLCDANAKAGKAKAALREERILRGQQLNEWEKQVGNMRRRVSEAETRAMEEGQDKALWEEKYAAVRRDLVRLQRGQKIADKNAKVSDSDIETRWRQLAFNIRQLAELLAQHIPTHGRLSQQNTQTRFSEIVECYGDVLLDSQKARLLLQAYIWRAADRYTLPRGAALAALAPQFDDLRLQMLAHLTHEDRAFFAPWFANGWTALDAKSIGAKNDPHVDASTEARMLLDFTPGGGKNEKAVHRVEEDLIAIFRVAQDLNTALGSSKAVFKQSNPSYGEPYDAQSMEVAGYGDEATPLSKVLFSVSPQVTKYGNADGQDHNSHMVLLKAAVVVQDRVEDMGASSVKSLI